MILEGGEIMNTQTALQAIRSQELQPLYLVLGTEKYLQDQIRDAFLKRLAVEDDDLNFAQFDMERDPLDSVLAEAESAPFFGDQRLIFVERPYFFTAEKKANAPEHDMDAFLTYLKQPNETSVVVFFADYEKLDERKKITKQLKKASELIDVHPLKEPEVRRYVQQTMENDGLKMDRQTIDLFLQLTDLDLSKTMQELEKLKIFAGETHFVSKQELLQLIPKTLEHNIFDLTGNVLSGNVEAALRIYQDLHLQGEETIKINAILIGQLRLLLQTRILMKAGYQQAKIAETLKIHPYRVKLAMQQVRNYQEENLVRLLDELVENDYLIKTGKVEKEFAFQLFVLQASQDTVK